MDEPIHIRPFGIVTENGVEHLLFDLIRPVGLRQIDEMGREFGDGLIPAQTFEQGNVFAQIYKIEKAVIDLAGIVPDIHREDEPEFEDQEEKPFDDLYGIGDEKGTLYAQEHDQDGYHQPHGQMFRPVQEPIHEQGRHEHGHRDREAIGGRHGLRGPEIQRDQKTAGTQDPVDAGDIDLPPDIGRELYRHLGPEIQADRFVDEGEGSADQGLAGDDGSRRGDEYTGDQEPVGDNGKKWIGAAQAALMLQQYPGALTQI